MATEAKLVGNFELTPEFETTVRSSVRDAEKDDAKPDSVEFVYFNRLLDVAGFYSTVREPHDVAGTLIPGGTVLLYHVLDKDHAGAALSEAVRSVIECLSAIDGDFALNYPDFPVLARVAGKITVYRRNTDNDFWDCHNRMELVPAPYEVAVYPIQGPGEDDLEDDDDEDDA